MRTCLHLELHTLIAPPEPTKGEEERNGNRSFAAFRYQS
jgi:hypothetical protein